ncbi:hypothetical protein ECZU26_20350 [Escherichia coli]|nr:hypothetical protein ECZU26_20350 [Escherichia coli]GHL78095.1 hypothetical protein ECZU34_58430 [Escherichia coli]
MQDAQIISAQRLRAAELDPLAVAVVIRHVQLAALALAPLEGTEQAGGQTVRRVVPDVAEAVLVLRLHHGHPLLLRCLSSTAGLSTRRHAA